MIWLLLSALLAPQTDDVSVLIFSKTAPYDDPRILQHIRGGITWAASSKH